MKFGLVKKQLSLSPHSKHRSLGFQLCSSCSSALWAASFQAQSGHKPPQSPPSLRFYGRTVSVVHGLLTSCYSLHVYVSFFCSHHILTCGCSPRILEKTNRFFKNTAKTSASGQVVVTTIKFTLPPTTTKIQTNHLKQVFKTLDIRQGRTMIGTQKRNCPSLLPWAGFQAIQHSLA